MSIPFVRQFDFEYGRRDQLSPRIQRVIADNPGPFTFTGTGVYIIGNASAAVIDPGPDTPKHRKALWEALDGRRVSHVLLTHHHLDHSPLAAPLAAAHGCKVYAFPLESSPPEARAASLAAEAIALEEGFDSRFNPDVNLKDGDIIKGDGWTIEALHTPGHTSNHLCFALLEENVLFSGDHIMGWSTSVVSPPDGHMGDYLSSLKRIKDRDLKQLWPTHGTSIDAPRPFIDAYIAHRQKREDQIMAAIHNGLNTIGAMVASIYGDVDKRLHPAAAHSVLSHLIHMEETGRVKTNGPPSLSTNFSAV